jgi:hypothetical protein
MILSRVTAHLKAQHWTAIAIDFLIVVFGVFIGMQVNNWNEARLQHQTARVYIERVREDLASNKEDLSQRAAYFAQTKVYALAALVALDKPPETLGKDFLIDVFQASQITPRTFGRDAYDEILSVGAVNAITDVSVRKRLANFYRSIGAQLAILAQVVSYREVVRRKMPYAAQAAIRAGCQEIVATSETGESVLSLPATCEIDLEPRETRQAVSAVLRADIRDDLVRRLSDLDNKLWVTQLMITRVELLDAYLAEARP